MKARARWLLPAARAALALLALATFALGARRTADLPRVARDARVMCEGLPDYAGFAATLPATARVLVVVDPGDERAGERFVCARLALAPRRVDARRLDEPAPVAGEADAVLRDLGAGLVLEVGP